MVVVVVVVVTVVTVVGSRAPPTTSSTLFLLRGRIGARGVEGMGIIADNVASSNYFAAILAWASTRISHDQEEMEAPTR